MAEKSLIDELSKPIDVIGRTIETPGSLSRNAILGALTDLTGAEDRTAKYEDIIKGKDYKPIAEFYDDVAHIFGGSYDTHGDNGLESTAKFLFELAGDIATDPMTYIPFSTGTSIGGKLSTALESAGKSFSKQVIKHTPEVLAKSSPKLVAAMEKEALKVGARTAVGGTYGALAPVEGDNQISGRLKNALIGATIVNSASPLTKGILGSTRLLSDSGVEMIYSHASPEVVEKFNNISVKKAFKVVGKTIDKFAPVKREIDKYTDQIIGKHGNVDTNKAVEILDNAQSDFTKRRNYLYANHKGKLTDDAKRAYTVQSNKEILQHLDQQGLLNKGSAVSDLVERNNLITDLYNRESLKREMFNDKVWSNEYKDLGYDELHDIYKNLTGKEFKPMIGISVHSPEILSKDAMNSLGNAKNGYTETGFMNRVSEELPNTYGYNGVERLVRESDRITYAMMNHYEKRASRFISELKHSKGRGAYAPLKKGLDTLDSVTNDMKGAMLTLNKGWIVNNLVENIYRTYIDDGMISAIKSGAKQVGSMVSRIPKLGKFAQSKEMKELIAVTETPEAANKFIKEMEQGGWVDVAVDRGAVGTNLFEDIMTKVQKGGDKRTLIADYGAEEIAAITKKAAERNAVLKAKDKTLEIGREVIGKTGSLIENTARLHTWKEYILKKASPEQLKSIETIGPKLAAEGDKSIYKLMDEATDKVNKMFFNYSDLTIGEEKIIKRMMPFYSFYSKNIEYWGNKISDDLQGTLRASKAMNNLVGYNPNETLVEKERLSEFERSVPHGVDKEGNVRTITNLSGIDFLQTLDDPVGSIQGKLHPLLNGSISLSEILGKKLGITDKKPTDALGRNILTSDSYNKTKNVTHNERKLALIDEMLGNPFGSFRDSRGNLKVQGDAIPVASTIISNTLTVPVLDTAAKLIDGGDLFNQLSPFKEKKFDLGNRRDIMKRNKRHLQKVIKERKRSKTAEAMQSLYSGRNNDVVESIDNAYREATPKENDINLNNPRLNVKKLPSSGWAKTGLLISPKGFNALLTSERGKSGTFAPVAQRRGNEPNITVGFEIYDRWPATYGNHKANEKIKIGDVVTEDEAWFQLTHKLRSVQSDIVKGLKKYNRTISQEEMDAMIESKYNHGLSMENGVTPKGHFSMARYMLYAPNTAKQNGGNSIYIKGLDRRRRAEYAKAKAAGDEYFNALMAELEKKKPIISDQQYNKIKDDIIDEFYYPEYEYHGKCGIGKNYSTCMYGKRR